MKIAIGCDHIVTDIKNEVGEFLRILGHEVIDMGTYDKERTHYPIYGKRVAEATVKGIVDFGIVICGTGVGITASAMKVKGSRGGLVRDVATARYVREVYNANILGLGGRIAGIGLMENIIEEFLRTPFKETSDRMRAIERLDEMVEEKPDTGDAFFEEFLEKWNRGEYHD